MDEKHLIIPVYVQQLVLTCNKNVPKYEIMKIKCGRYIWKK